MPSGFATTAIVHTQPPSLTDQPIQNIPVFATTAITSTTPTRTTVTPVKVLPAFTVRFYKLPSEVAVSEGTPSLASITPQAKQAFATSAPPTITTTSAFTTGAPPTITTTSARALAAMPVHTTTSLPKLLTTPLASNVTPVEIRPYGLTTFSETASTGQKLGHATPYVSNTSTGEATTCGGTNWRLTSYSGYSAHEAEPCASTKAPRTACTSPKPPWSAKPSHATLATGRKTPWSATGRPGAPSNEASRALATETPRTATAGTAVAFNTTQYGATTIGTKPRFATTGTRTTTGTHYASAHGLKLAEANEKVGYTISKGEATSTTGTRLAEANTTTTYMVTSGEATPTSPLPSGLVTTPNIPPSATCVHKDMATLLGGRLQIRPGITGPYGFLFATEEKPPTPALATPPHAAFTTHAKYETKETVYACAQYPMNERLRAALLHRMAIRSVQVLLETEDGTVTILWKDGVAKFYGPAEARNRAKKLLLALAELDATQNLQS